MNAQPPDNQQDTQPHLTCDWYGCTHQALWQDGLHGHRFNGGKLWCQEHALKFRLTHQLVPYYGGPRE